MYLSDSQESTEMVAAMSDTSGLDVVGSSPSARAGEDRQCTVHP